MQATDRYRPSPSAAGPLKIWQHPVPGRSYVIGIDSSGGGPDGDFAAAVVLDAEACAVVAIWRDHVPAIPWGKCCARLGHFYNLAMLSFETHPSAHGLSAAHAAAGMGYPKLFRHRMYGRTTRDSTDEVGFHTTSVTKPQCIDRVKQALDDNCPIPSQDLVDELRLQRWDVPKTGLQRQGAPRMVTASRSEHDDLVMSYAIALMSRDICWVAGQLRAEKVGPKTESERYWHAQRTQERRRLPRRA